MTRPRIFISNSFNDTEWAQQFARELGKRGLNVWFAQFEVGLGRIWADAIEKGLRESEIILFLIRAEDLEATGLSNANLFLELGAAISLGKRIIPIFAEEVDREKLPPQLRLIRGLVRTSPEATAEQFAREFEALPREAA